MTTALAGSQLPESARTGDIRALLVCEAGPRPDFERLFAQLYLEATRQFAQFVDTGDGPELIHDIARRFFGLYREYLPQDGKAGTTVARHWWGYRRAVRDLGRNPHLNSYCSALFHGARAHSRYDLAEAITQTYFSRRDQGLSKADMNELCAYLLQKETDLLFSRAARDFMTGQRAVLAATYGASSTSIMSRCADRTNVVWVAVVQRWRRQAVMEARLCIETDRQPVRPFVQITA